MQPPAPHLILVPHTHWDREWYRTHEQFRFRLISLVDDLLDLLERDPTYTHFMLDGQTIVVDDYVEVRPAGRARIERLVRAGRLAIGPWHVLPDEWLVSGEALIRNLRVGMRKADALGGAMQVGYVPDQFGHVGQLPQLLAGMGFDAAVLWRGVGDDVDRTLFWWEAPDGTRLRTAYLPSGYGNGANLPADPAALAARLRTEADALLERSDIPTLLVMTGTDHELPTPELPAALAAALAGQSEWSAEIGSLRGYVERAAAECGDDLPSHRGELRSGLRAPLLPGCASARAPQKRSEFLNDRLLTRYLEPLAAWLSALGGDGDAERIEYAWRVALENHPHDSVCGCSVDAVHDQMDARFVRVREIASEHLTAIEAALAGRIAVPADGFGPGARAPLAVYNPNAGGTAAVDASLRLDVPLSPTGKLRSFHLRGADGRRIPATAEVEAPAERTGRGIFRPDIVSMLLPGLRRDFNAHFVNEVRTRRRGDRLEVRVRLGESEEAGFDLEAERKRLQAELADESLREIEAEATLPPRVRLRFVDSLPGQGLRVYEIAAGDARAAEPLAAERLASGGAAIENAHWRVESDARGRITLYSRGSGLRIDDAIRLVSEADRGDEYNFDPLPGGGRVDAPERVTVRAKRLSGGEVRLRLDARYRVPLGLTENRDARTARTAPLPVTIDLRLLAGLDRIDIDVRLDNASHDHRLRLHVRAPFEPLSFEVESAFEVVDRPIAPSPESFGAARPSEFPIGAVPQRTFATLSGTGGLALTLANRGVAEVEAAEAPGGGHSLACTLLRAVGWLSRADLRLRPGPAGPMLETPGAQVPGPHRAELSLRLHRADDPRRIAEAHGYAFPPRAFAGLSEDNREGPLRDGSRLVTVDDPEVVVSALEPRADGGCCVRVYNASGEGRRVALRVAARGNPRRVDLAERKAERLSVGPAGEVLVALGPWEIATVLA